MRALGCRTEAFMDAASITGEVVKISALSSSMSFSISASYWSGSPHTRTVVITS